MLCFVALLALFASIQGRAVNISNTWVLPEEGFPVFYRYFRDRISWYEADAVCQFHHANLVTVDTTAQYDAVRAYLKELDISSAVWVGLIRSNPDGDFTWTDYRGLSGEGYWSSAPDPRAAPLCAAADPASDYRWEARACGGPTVASFICELPVPQWALGNEGCMVRALPALTVLYLPESAAVQLTTDCGMAGVKRVQCTGHMKREDLLRDLSCADEEELSSSSSVLSTGVTWPITTDTTLTEQDTTNEPSTEENVITTEHEDIINQQNMIKETITPKNFNSVPLELSPSVKQQHINKLNKIYLNKNINFNIVHNNNLQSNDIPKLVNDDNYLTNEESEKLEDEKHMQHKMLHDQLARLGNFETIFTQPTDHFVPPLVMAKSKISDDMTVLSLEEKHAQQLAEQQYLKQNVFNIPTDHNVDSALKTTTPEINKIETTKYASTVTVQPVKYTKDIGKKDILKSHSPKKYNDKFYDPKGKVLKAVDNKSFKVEKTTEVTPIQTESSTKNVETTSAKVVTQMDDNKPEEDPAIDLTVILKGPVAENEERTYSNDSGEMPKIDLIQNDSSSAETEIISTSTHKIPEVVTVTSETKSENDITLNHEVIKITVIKDDHDKSSAIPTVFEITTKMPIFKDTVSAENMLSSTQNSNPTTVNTNDVTVTPAVATLSTQTITETTQGHTITSSATDFSTASAVSNNKAENITTEKVTVASTTYTPLTTKIDYKTTTVTSTDNSVNEATSKGAEEETTFSTSAPYIIIKDKTDFYNITESHEDEFEKNGTDTSEAIDDFQSPLLSAANEPLHRPNRSRRPQQPPNRLNKFNPFRILG